ncbi:MAG: Ldh family oxidoreductase, partial [Bacteroidia bacterium]|nr:Ldh family oxidoreductase [Bacteroidia bacterium]
QQPGKGIGHFLGAMRIDAFRPANDFKKDMDHWIEGFRNAKTIPGEEKVLVPGDPEREMELIRIKEGIPLLEIIVNDLKALQEKLGGETLKVNLSE